MAAVQYWQVPPQLRVPHRASHEPGGSQLNLELGVLRVKSYLKKPFNILASLVALSHFTRSHAPFPSLPSFPALRQLPLCST